MNTPPLEVFMKCWRAMRICLQTRCCTWRKVVLDLPSSGGAGVQRLVPRSFELLSPCAAFALLRASRALACVLLIGALGACGTTSTKSSPSATAQPTPTANAQELQVLSAYRASWAAFEQASANADPSFPGLSATMINPQLATVQQKLTANQSAGIVGQGNVELYPYISSIGETQATVKDCVYSKSILIYKATGQPVPPITQPQHDAVVSTLTEVSQGIWKVMDQTVTPKECL